MEETRARRVLGVARDAGPAEVERAFRTLARSTHPDHGGDPARFRELVRARRTLLDLPGRRTPLDHPGVRDGAKLRRPAPVVVVPDPSPWREVRAAVRARRRRQEQPRRVI